MLGLGYAQYLKPPSKPEPSGPTTWTPAQSRAARRRLLERLKIYPRILHQGITPDALAELVACLRDEDVAERLEHYPLPAEAVDAAPITAWEEARWHAQASWPPRAYAGVPPAQLTPEMRAQLDADLRFVLGEEE